MTARERELLEDLFRIHQLEDRMINALAKYTVGNSVYEWLQSLREPLRCRRTQIENEIIAVYTKET